VAQGGAALEDFTVVVPDLRGYGDSSKPPAGDNFINYAKRALALMKGRGRQ
jgi:haloacetate dehalogenase